MSDKGQDTQEPLVQQTGNPGSSANPESLQQSGPGGSGAKPNSPVAPVVRQLKPASVSAAGGPNAKPNSISGAIDAAKQSALDVACVQACTTTVQAYRTGSIDKSIATHKIIIAFFRAGRADPKDTAPWLKQLEDHDAACVSAAAVAQGGTLLQGKGATSGNSATYGTTTTKRKRGNGDKRGNGERDDSDSDSDGDNRHIDLDDHRTRARRRSYNPAAAGFRAAIYTGGPVSPHVQETLDARDNYSADLKQAKRDILRGGRCPPFPSDLIDAVLCDNAVDFNRIYSARFSSTVDDGVQHRLADGIFIRIPVQRTKRRVIDQSDWQLCFNSWFDIVCFLYPHRRSELLSYLEYIMDLFASLHKSFHDRVLLADVHMRNTIQGDSRASFFDRDRLQSCALRYISPWGAEAVAQSQFDDAPCVGEEAHSSGKDFPHVEDAAARAEYYPDHYDNNDDHDDVPQEHVDHYVLQDWEGEHHALL